LNPFIPGSRRYKAYQDGYFQFRDRSLRSYHGVQ
jgi:hypothetical protein